MGPMATLIVSTQYLYTETFFIYLRVLNSTAKYPWKLLCSTSFYIITWLLNSIPWITLHYIGELFLQLYSVEAAMKWGLITLQWLDPSLSQISSSFQRLNYLHHYIEGCVAQQIHIPFRLPQRSWVPKDSFAVSRGVLSSIELPIHLCPVGPGDKELGKFGN